MRGTNNGGNATQNFVPVPMPYGSVLIVDDVDANLYVARGLFAFYDLKVDSCSGGQAAIEKIKHGKVYDIVFMDHMMPGLDGIETMHVLRGLGYSHPIVALTANVMVSHAKEFIEAGFDDFLSKPIQIENLNDVLVKFIRDKQLPEVLASVETDWTAKANGSSKPASSQELDDFLNSPEMLKTLREEFVKTQRGAFYEITRAIQKSDIKTAHRVAHTLKGVAGLIKKDALTALAAVTEKTFKQGKMPGEELLGSLEEELRAVLAELGYTGEV